MVICVGMGHDDVIDHRAWRQTVPRQVQRDLVLIASVRTAVDQDDPPWGTVPILWALNQNGVTLPDVDKAHSEEVLPLRLSR